MGKIIIFLCILILSSCAPQRYNRDYMIRRNLMILENYELPRNKQLKFSKYKVHKQMDKRNKKYLKKINSKKNKALK